MDLWYLTTTVSFGSSAISTGLLTAKRDSSGIGEVGRITITGSDSSDDREELCADRDVVPSRDEVDECSGNVITDERGPWVTDDWSLDSVDSLSCSGPKT
ncbi:hypothetical protein OGAPHI_001319 [Ogataea philodendri]|uniref:Uncharacterized protein n=1 Tax=Ogataea philodendri TaxID=1378263 RepID=A0A9P8T8Z0_9ASCO|nr:uncharacterized protein OGAPHI_001319 [Ogataea philodendri]KAH3670803.1 hypothetical protein OGAPHI_001319 [Ogataea philodendri]